MSNDLLPAVELDPPKPAVAAVVWMHGLGANGHDFASVPPVLGLPPELPVRFVFPHAPSIPVTLNMGFVMPAWYDIMSLSLDERGQDADGIERSAAAIHRLIARENERGVATEKIVVAGFSQGGAMALHVGLAYPEKLAGIMALSSYLIFPERLDDDAAAVNRETPILQAHGSYDPMVRPQYGKMSRDALVGAGYDVEWREYPMEHAVCPEEIADVGGWLRRVLA